MANYNRVVLVGNLTRNPQLANLPSGTAVCEFGMAINRQWRGQDGQNREEVCFVDCNVYGRQAEVFNQYMAKGRSVLIEGYLRYRQWDAQDGSKRSKLTVTAERFQFLGDRGGAGGGGPNRSSGRPTGRDDQPPPDDDSQIPATDDDIPF